MPWKFNPFTLKLDYYESAQLNPSVGNLSFSGSTTTMTAGENVGFGDVCYVKSDGKMWKANATAIATCPGLYMALGTILSNASGSFGVRGAVRGDSLWTFTPGALLFLSTTSGLITTTAPSSTNNVIQVLGVALASHIIDFYPQLVMVEHT